MDTASPTLKSLCCRSFPSNSHHRRPHIPPNTKVTHCLTTLVTPCRHNPPSSVTSHHCTPSLSHHQTPPFATLKSHRPNCLNQCHCS
ncbi:hypothetical protein ES332_D03G077000v1 [Gossypium tomentosum]|uniref:Uncharacterized protein n=1 Tax=Gossypium tomentosum TaxID=34277 RepID=A0A5D2LLV3_GOSTO|nr:hypothetical protein ES332_D03G077000v1 [Gossypium tomentosum]